MNYITQAEYMSINQYADQMNNLVLSSRKIRFNTRKIITLNGFQNAFKDESLIIITWSGVNLFNFHINVRRIGCHDNTELLFDLFGVSSSTNRYDLNETQKLYN